MALSINNFIPNFFAKDDYYVALSDNFSQVFPEARIISIDIKEDVSVMSHPLEDGTTLSDHAIIQPVNVNINMILPPDVYDNVYNTIKIFFTNHTKLAVFSKVGVYNNLIINSMPHQESADLFNAVPLTLSLKEALFVYVASTKLTTNDVQNPIDSDVVRRGKQSPITVINPQARNEAIDNIR